MVIIGPIVGGFTRNIGATVFLLWLAFAQFTVAFLVAGSMYVKREGWAVIDGSVRCPSTHVLQTFHL